jgi:hypothetical protein
MNDRGQVFTLDMLFALALTALVIGYSGLALGHAQRQVLDHTLRYTLERTANDAADVLVKTSGWPINWSDNVSCLEVPGLMENDIFGMAVPNSLSMRRFENLRRLCASYYWNSLVSAAQAVKNIFDNSEKFMISLLSEVTGENIWPPIYPGWDMLPSSGVENSLEVVVVKRLVSTGMMIENVIENIVHENQASKKIYFTVAPTELDIYDWYVVLVAHSPSYKPELRIWVNRDPDGLGNWDYKVPPDMPPFKLRWHGIDYPQVSLREGQNYIKIMALGSGNPVDVYVVKFRRCTPSDFALLPPFCTLEVKLWR